MASVIQWITEHWAWICGLVYLVINELIAVNPNLKSNSIVQLLVNILKAVTQKPNP